MTGFLDGRAGLNGRRAAVIGGGAGVGAALTLALAGAGVDVAFCDIDDASSADTRQQAEALGVKVLYAHADVTKPEELDAFYARLAQWAPALDIVVNVAGGVKRRDMMDGARDVDAREIRLNYGYIVDSVRHAVPLIRATGRGGAIINFTTIEAHRGAATFAVYAGAKAATTNFTRCVAVELGKEKIRVNCIAPDTTPSKTSHTAVADEIRARVAAFPQEIRDMKRDMYVPMKAYPDTDALANAVLFLASDLAAFVTGVTLHVDGGTMASSGFVDWPYGDGYMPSPLGGTLARFV